MKTIRKTVLWAAVLTVAAALFLGGAQHSEAVGDFYLDMPAVTLLQEPKMMSAAIKPQTIAHRGLDRIDKEELYLLAKIIECEARYESYEGKIAVGAVVLNRVMSSKFPNTVKGAIFQKGQFQPIIDGGWDKIEPTEQSYRAAMDALAGIRPAGSNGQSVGNAQFFIYECFAGKKAAKWFKEKLNYVTTIGNHDFYCR